MLATTFRLSANKKYEFTRSFSTPYFLLKIAKNNSDEKKFGFIVSKKVDKRAVIRNRAKRVVRSCIEELLSQIHPGYTLLFILKSQSVNAERDDVFKTIQILLQKQGIL
jgi:ribonuclease P protein component